MRVKTALYRLLGRPSAPVLSGRGFNRAECLRVLKDLEEATDRAERFVAWDVAYRVITMDGPPMHGGTATRLATGGVRVTLSIELYNRPGP